MVLTGYEFSAPLDHDRPDGDQITVYVRQAVAPDKEGANLWMFGEYEYLRPLKGGGEILAAYEGWRDLYDQAVLRANTVPCAAAVYHDDMYVDRVFSEETAQSIQGIKLWVRNEYEHDALWVDGERVLDRLLGMLRGEVKGTEPGPPWGAGLCAANIDLAYTSSGVSSRSMRTVHPPRSAPTPTIAASTGM